MKIGILEISLIIVIILAAGVIFRLLRSRKKEPARRGGLNQGVNQSPSKNSSRFLNRAGITLVIVGFVALVAAAGFFRWVLQAFLVAFVIFAAGYILILISRRNR